MTTLITANNNNNLISSEIFTSSENFFLISTNTDTEIDALGGNDTIVIGPAVGLVTDFTVRGSTGDDSIQLLAGAGATNSSIFGGQGDDTIRIGSLVSFSLVQSLTGNNAIQLTADFQDSTLQTGSGTDLIQTGRLLRTTLRAGASDDLIEITGGGLDNFALFTSQVFLGSGNDTLSIALGDVLDSQIQSLTGNNVVEIGQDLVNSAVTFGDGDDSLEVLGEADEVVIRTAAGDDFVSIGSDTDLSSIHLGAGNDTVVFGGDVGNSRVQSLSGDNLFDFGTNISGFFTTVTAGDGADTIALADNGIIADDFFSNNTITGIETAVIDVNFGVLTIGENAEDAGITSALIEGDIDAEIDASGFTNSITLNGGVANLAFLTGGEGDDSLTASSAGDSILTGGEGADLFVAQGDFTDITDLGNGDDTLTVDSADTNVDATISDDGGTVTVNAVDAAEVNITLSAFADINNIDASSSEVGINFFGGNTDIGSTIAGGSGNDTLTLSTDIDDDFFADITSVETVIGDTFNSIVLGEDAQTAGIVSAEDALEIDASDYTVAIELTAAETGSILIGGSGNDTITGGDGDDNITGGAGADIINAGAGNNFITDAGNGADVITHDSVGGTVFITVTGTDVVTLTATVDGAFAEIGNGVAGNVNASTSTAGVTIDGSLSGRVANTFTGGTGDDTILGGAGNDILNGGAGGDQISGGAGNDIITGGIGADDLDGGTGNNTFVFAVGDSFTATSTAGATAEYLNGVDVITGFTVNSLQQDSIINPLTNTGTQGANPLGINANIIGGEVFANDDINLITAGIKNFYIGGTWNDNIDTFTYVVGAGNPDYLLFQANISASQATLINTGRANITDLFNNAEAVILDNAVFVG